MDGEKECGNRDRRDVRSHALRHRCAASGPKIIALLLSSFLGSWEKVGILAHDSLNRAVRQRRHDEQLHCGGREPFRCWWSLTSISASPSKNNRWLHCTVESFITADRVSKIERHVEQEREIDAKHVLEWRHSELTLSAGWKRYDHGQQKEVREG